MDFQVLYTCPLELYGERFVSEVTQSCRLVHPLVEMPAAGVFWVTFILF